MAGTKSGVRIQLRISSEERQDTQDLVDDLLAVTREGQKLSKVGEQNLHLGIGILRATKTKTVEGQA